MKLLKANLQDGISYVIEYFIRVREIFWSWYFGLYSPLVMAQIGHRKQGKNTEGERSLSGEVREPSGTTANETGRDDRSAERNEFRIKEKEKRYVEKQRQIEDLQNQIEQHIKRSFQMGNVDSLPMKVGMRQEVLDDVYIKLLHVDERFDIFMLTGGSGSSLNEHKHQQKQYMKVLEGKVTVTIDGESHKITQGDEISVNPDIPHELEFNKDSKLLAIYYPPVSFHPLKFNFPEV